MTVTILALILRILSNPAANGVQKYLVKKNSAVVINFCSYLFLSLFCIILITAGFAGENIFGYGLEYYFYVLFAGILCTAGSICLIKALQTGEMSVLGPINSYKCVVGLVIGFLFLGEIPSAAGLVGTVLIIWGSGFIFDTVKKSSGLSVFLRKDIILRFCALLFSGCEAVVLKKIILMSSVTESFIWWCFTGCLFSFVLMVLFKPGKMLLSGKDTGLCSVIALCLGIMQYSTNIVFERMNVGLSLALFQLSGIAAVIMGYKIFNEKQLKRKIIASIIMIAGSALILIC